MNIDEACGRGVVLYTATWLNALQYIPSTPAQESAWCTVKLRGQDKLMVGCVYRSPTSLLANDEAINNVIKNITTSNECSHILIMGDFNYPNVCWNTWMTFAAHDASDYKFVEMMKNCFLFQHVLKPTRVRINQTPSVLDLVFTNEEGMISNLEVLAPLGRSDHGMLSFSLNCYTDFEATDVKKRQYHKGNYELLRKNLNIDWKSVLAPFEGDAEKQLKILSDKIEGEVDLCIPSYTYRPGNNLRRIPVNDYGQDIWRLKTFPSILNIANTGTKSEHYPEKIRRNTKNILQVEFVKSLKCSGTMQTPS